MAFLGQLMIELGVNMGAFRDGLRDATLEAKKFGNDVAKEFRELGESLRNVAGAAAAFGPSGVLALEAISGMGEAAGNAMRMFASLNSELGIFMGGAAGLVAAGASLSASAIGFTIETAKQIKEMGEQAQMAGLTIERYSALSAAAQVAGVNQERFATGIERLSRTMEAAAQGNRQAQATFDALKIAYVDNSGKLRDTGDIMSDIAERFAHMEDGAQKTALAMQLMGRGGASMIPVLNEGAEGLGKAEEMGRKLGTVLDKTAEQDARKLTIAMTEIKMAGQGLANHLEEKLGPVVANVAQEIVDWLSDPAIQKGISDLLDGVVNITKVFLSLATIVADVFRTIGNVIAGLIGELQAIFEGAGKLLSDAWHRNWSAAKDDAAKIWGDMKATAKNTAGEIAEDWGHIPEQMDAIWGQHKAPTTETHAKNFHPTTQVIGRKEAADADPIAKMVADLDEAVKQQQTLMGHVEATSLQYAVLQADAKAYLEIQKRHVEFAEKIKALESQKEAAVGTTAKSNVQSKIDELKRWDEELTKDTPHIIEQQEKLARGGFTLRIDDELRKQTEQLHAQTEAYEILSNAIGKSITQQRAAAGAAAAAEIRAKGGNDLQAQVAAENALAKFDLDRVKAANDMLRPMTEILDGYEKQRDALNLIMRNNRDNPALINMAKEKMIELNLQYDQQMLKFGTFKEQFGAWVDTIAIAGHNLGQMFLGDMSKALDGLNQQIAQLVVTGKANFAQLGKSIKESLLQTGLKFTEGKIAGFLEKELGFGGKPGDSPSKPIYAAIVQDLSAGGLAKTAGSAIGGGFGDFIGKIGGFFGGFLAEGGDVTPGKAYVVGEKHPEFFIPNAAGKVMPSLKVDAGAKSTSVHAHFHGVTDADSFRRSEGQVMSHIAVAVGRAVSRR